MISLKLLRRGPVAKAAAALLTERITQAETAFASEADRLKQQTDAAKIELEQRLEAERQNALQKHVNRIFTVAS